VRRDTEPGPPFGQGLDWTKEKREWEPPTR
jgi:hypothetical protein